MTAANRCLFCGADSYGPDHLWHCDGRQGATEAAIEDAHGAACRWCGQPHAGGPEHCQTFDPLLVSGIVPATWETSEAAAISIDANRDTQRAAVYDAIRSAGLEGRTDDEVQIILGIDGSSERPRRWELWKLDAIAVRRDEAGEPVRRETRTHRRAVVWIAREAEPCRT